MQMYNTTKIYGSASLQTSVAGEEILNTILYDFELINDQSCHISINGGPYIYLRALQGIQMPVMKSIKIQEDSITFNWIGGAM